MKKLFILLALINYCTVSGMEKIAKTFRLLKVHKSVEDKFEHFDQLPTDIQSYILEFVIIDLLQKYNNTPQKFFTEFSKLFANKKIAKMLRNLIPNKEESVITCGSPVNFHYVSEMAIAKKSTKLINLITEHIGFGTDKKEINMALLAAAYAGNEKLAEYLIINGSNVNFKHPTEEMTPLIYAATSGQAKMIQFLIKNTASVNFRTPSGFTALIAAINNNCLDAAKALINNGAQINTPNKCKQTALMRAAYHGYTDIVKLLVENGADIEIKDGNYDDALTLAHRTGRRDIVYFLAKKLWENKN